MMLGAKRLTAWERFATDFVESDMMLKSDSLMSQTLDDHQIM